MLSVHTATHAPRCRPNGEGNSFEVGYLQIRRKLSLGDCFVHLEHRCPPYGWHFSARFSTTLQEFP